MQSGVETRTRRARRDTVPPAPSTIAEAAPAPYRATRAELRRLVMVFVLTRLLVTVAGVGFLDTLLKTGWQILDIRLLRHDLFRSIWYLHSQPPLFNVYLGALVHLPGSAGGWGLVTYSGLGLALVIGLDLLMLELRTPPRVAWVAAVVFSVLPSTIAYEHFLFYTYFVTTALCWGSLAVARYARTRSTGWGVAATSLFAAVALTRASYHLVWLVALAALILIAVRPRSRRALVWMLLPVLVVTGWYVKTFVMFGQFATSSWTGMNMAHVVLARVPRAELQKMVDRGELSTDVLHGPFKPLAAYGVKPTHTGVPALDEVKQSGSPNFNNEAYIAISSRFLHDDLTYARKHPGQWLSNIVGSFRIYFLPAQQYSYFGPNLQTRGLAQVADRVPLLQARPYTWNHVLPRPGSSKYFPQADQVAWLVVAQYAAVFFLTPLAAWAFVRRRGRLDPVMLTSLVIGLTVWWTMFVDNLFDLSENNRFRYETDAIVWALSVALLVAGVQRLRARRARRLEAAPTS
jgi:hypothetical protein